MITPPAISGGEVATANLPFMTAFFGWYAGAGLEDVLRPQPCLDQDAVVLDVLIGNGALTGYAAGEGVDIAAMLGSECWDLLYSEDVALTETLDG